MPAALSCALVTAGARVLLTVDESHASLAAARGLRAAGHEVHVAATREDTYVARSRAVAGVQMLAGPDRDPDAFASALAAVAERLHAALVLPGTEATMRALTGREGRFSASTTLGTCSQQALELATSKVELQRLAAEAGLDVLPAVELGADDLEGGAAQLDFPAVVKPLRSVEPIAGGGLERSAVRRVADVGELRRLVEAAPGRRWLVQRELRGRLAAIGAVAWRGELICATHQISPRIWPVQRGITCYAVTVPADRDRERGVAGIVRRIGWSGIVGVQFLLAEGRAYAIDLNPRIYGSIGLAIAAGQNLPAIWASLLLGGEPAVAPARAGVRYRVEEDDLRALAAAFRAGRRREALAGLLPRPRTAHAVLSLRDPRPALVSAAKLARAVRRKGA